MKPLPLLLVISMVAVAQEVTAQDAQCVRERTAMTETIRAYARSHVGDLGQQGLSERVLEAMGQTQRHLFTPERSCSIAYADRPISIGLGQTISQPFIVALMTQLAEVAPDDVVLEVGTGSGYQAAILGHLARKVCTIEIIPQLAETAAKTLRDLAYDNVSVRLGDGYAGWPECGPFDAIVVTAALGQVPPPPIEQPHAGAALPKPTIFIFDKDYQNPRVQQASAGVEYALNSSTSVSVNYLFVHGDQLSRSTDINIGPSTPAQLHGRGDRPGRCRTTGSAPVRSPNFARIISFQSSAVSTYHGLTVEAHRRFSGGFQARAPTRSAR